MDRRSRGRESSRWESERKKEREWDQREKLSGTRGIRHREHGEEEDGVGRWQSLRETVRERRGRKEKGRKRRVLMVGGGG